MGVKLESEAEINSTESGAESFVKGFCSLHSPLHQILPQAHHAIHSSLQRTCPESVPFVNSESGAGVTFPFKDYYFIIFIILLVMPKFSLAIFSSYMINP